MLSRAISRRSVQSSISAVRFYTEGATGAPRASGSQDSFNVSQFATLTNKPHLPAQLPESNHFFAFHVI